MALRPFETEILERFSNYGTAPDLTTGRKGVKGVWIKGHLRTERADYQEGMYRRWVRFTEAAALRRVDIKPGDIHAFVTYFWLLRRMGLVRFYTERPGERGFNRRYFTVTPGRESDPRWENPFQAAYPSADWKKLSVDERRSYRRKYAKSSKKTFP